jgi:hypothetical protein
MFKNRKSVVRKLAVARFGPPAFEPVLEPEHGDPKKGTLAARSHSKRTLIVESFEMCILLLLVVKFKQV